MITIIIPTLWRSPHILEMLPRYIACKLVEEIIIIDNNRRFFDFYDEVHKKIVLIQPHSNIYVNPAWNMGAAIAKANLLCIANDDLLFNVQRIFRLVSSFDEDYDIIGLHKKCFNRHQGRRIVPARRRTFGYGCLMFIPKESWKNIPSSLRIWYGDNYLFKFLERKFAVIFPIRGQVECSSKLTRFNQVRRRDKFEFRRL